MTNLKMTDSNLTSPSLKLTGAPTVLEWILIVFIWVGFGAWFYFLKDASLVFLGLFFLLLLPGITLAFFQEYDIRGNKLFYRPAFKKLFGLSPIEIDLSQSFRITGTSESSLIVASDPGITALSFIPFKNYHIVNDRGNRLAPIVGKAVPQLIPILQKFSGFLPSKMQ